MPHSKPYHLLIVDDEHANLDLLARRLRIKGFTISTADSADNAKNTIALSMPDLILLDVLMPATSGLEFLHHLRANPQTQTTPIIMVSALDNTDDIVQAIQSGANDYVTKPINLPVLLARIETQLRFAGLIQQLETQMRILSNLAAFDQLTETYNRRSMDDALQGAVERSIRYGHDLSLLIVDLDLFKQINDTHGHQAGDLVLQELARRIKSELRATDILCRFGGDEFVCILIETNLTAAAATANRLCNAIAGQPFQIPQGPLNLGISVGVTSAEGKSSLNAQRLLAEADQALYQAKRAGRNRMAVFDDPAQLSQPLADTQP